jgi:hypothetical protein
MRDKIIGFAGREVLSFRHFLECADFEEVSL